MLILIKPALENWLLKCCEEIGFNKTSYPFLKDTKTLGNILKKESVEQNKEVKKFFTEIMAMKPKAMVELKNRIQQGLK